jgi:hypothetical protein
MKECSSEKKKMPSQSFGVHRTSRRKGSSFISTTFNVSQMAQKMTGIRYRRSSTRKLFTSDRRVKLFVSTLLLITVIEMETTSGPEQTGIISES